MTPKAPSERAALLSDDHDVQIWRGDLTGEAGPHQAR